MSLNNLRYDYQAGQFRQNRQTKTPVMRKVDTHAAKYPLKNILGLVLERMISWLEKEDSQILVFFMYSLFITGYLYLFIKTLVIL